MGKTTEIDLNKKRRDAVKPTPVPIELDKPRSLFYDFNALITLEDMYGSIETAFGGIEEMKLKTIRDLLWVGLIHEDEELTSADVGKMIFFGNLQYVAERILEATEVALPDAKETEGEEDLGK